MASTSVRRAETDPNNGSNTTATFSVWIKRSLLGAYQTIYNHRYSNSYEFKFMMYNDDRLYVICTRSSTVMEFLTTRRFRDTNAWYHIVIALDSTQATNTNRVKIYVNGQQETAFDTATYPAQDAVLNLDGGASYYNNVGSRGDGSSEYWDGCMSYMAKVDGTQESPSIFGQTDATTGEWSIKTTITPSSGWGNKPFFILKDGNSLTDQSGSSKDFTSHSGSLTKTEDCPSNVFCNFNAIGPATDVTLANGNNNATYGTSSSRTMLYGTLGAASGKYYWECEIQGSSSANNAVLGVTTEIDYSTQVPGITNYAWGFRGYDGAVYNNNSSVGGTWATFTNGDIIGVAINLDDEQGGLNKLYFAKNGTWLNGADPSNHSSTTGVVGITRPEDGTSGFIFPVFGDAGTSATPKFKMNWGNGVIGSTTVASAGTNASNNGIFEYDVPTGFTALSTKGLNL